MSFQKDYPDVSIFKLEQNYRSSSTIVEAANSIIEKNKTKLDKEIWTENDAGSKVKVMRTYSEAEEGRFVAASIFENSMNKQLDNNQFAILYRTNAQSRAIEDALRKQGIDYRMYGGLSFYQRKEIKDTLGYLRLLINPNDEEALKRVINYPKRSIGTSTIDKLAVAANHYGKSIFEIIQNLDKVDLKLNSGTRMKLMDFSNMIRHFQIEAQTKDAFEVAELVLKTAKIIKDLETDGTPEAVSRVENVQELMNGIKDFITVQKEKEEDASLAFFLEDVALATDLDNENKDDKPRVSLMTIHLSKGLEYPIVYIVGLEETLFPSAMSMNTRSELEEERRLFYVALTRAEQEAYLSYAETRYRWGKLVDCEPSRFLEEIDEKYLEYLTPKRKISENRFIPDDIFDQTPQSTVRFKKPMNRRTIPKPNQKPKLIEKKNFATTKNLKKISNATLNETPSNLFDSAVIVGNIVEHQRFGKGEVIRMEGAGPNKKAEIKFENFGNKNLLLQFAKLKILG